MRIMVLDTETANGITLEDGTVDLSQSLVYDLGYAILDTDTDEILKTESFAIADIFCDHKDMMKSAYFAEKIPSYWEEIKNDTRVLTNMYRARKTLLADLKAYNVRYVSAHNTPFDLRALSNTERYLTKSKNRWFFPYGTEFIDTLILSNKTFGKDEDYVNFCQENGYMTKHKTPRPQMKAETIYRYLTNNTDFEEEHKGLDDVLIETEILKALLKNGVVLDKEEEE